MVTTALKRKKFDYLILIISSVYFFYLLITVLLYKLVLLLEYYNENFFYFYTLLTSVFLISRFLFSYLYEDNHKKTYRKNQYPTLSFVISCKNEEDSIYDTIKACLTSNYPAKMDCIAINDGSTDNTLTEMNRSKLKWKDKLTIISFEKNRGKREGMSEGVLVSKSDVIVFVDSDTFLHKDSAKIIVEHFLADKKVGAVSGNTHVKNVTENYLAKMQASRYGVAFDTFKTCESLFGAVTCCPGCFSAYRKEAIMQVMDRWRSQKFLGSRSTFGDDRSLTNYVLRKWKVIYCQKAIAETIVPTSLMKFFKQQFRWKKSWIREGFNAGSFIWKKNPIASISFYLNLIIPIVGPIILIRILVAGITNPSAPLFFITGVLAVGVLFGLYDFITQGRKYWYYICLFSLMYTLVLIWQMPYAILKVRDTKWGTR